MSGNFEKLYRVLHARAFKWLISVPKETELNSHVEARRGTHSTFRDVYGRRGDGESSRDEGDDRDDEHHGNDRGNLLMRDLRRVKFQPGRNCPLFTPFGLSSQTFLIGLGRHR